jgi:hypothetical protein
MGNDTETTVPTSSLAPTSFDTLPWAPPLASRTPAPRVVPEPPRRGEVGGEPCGVCDGHSTSAVWSDEHWTLHPPVGASLPGTVWMASPRPLGMLDASGPLLPLWEDVLPNVSDEAMREAAQRVAVALERTA